MLSFHFRVKAKLGYYRNLQQFCCKETGGREDEVCRKLDTSAPTHPQRGGKPAGWPGPSVWLHYSLLQLELWASPTSPRSSAKRWRHKQGSVLRRIALVKCYCSISLSAKTPLLYDALEKIKTQNTGPPRVPKKGRKERDTSTVKRGRHPQQIELELCRWS